MRLKWRILGIFLLVTYGHLPAQEFQYSRIYPVPDLSFYPGILTGLDVLEQMDFAPLKGKKIAILCNQTAVNRQGKHILDYINSQWDITVKTIFTPEYGLFGRQDERVRLSGKDDIDPVTGARIINLFSRYVIPPRWSLTDVDLILVDLVDPGVRYCTYVTTVTKMMEVAASLQLPVIVLDRPNPLRGDKLDGPIIRTDFQSFIGYHLVPIRHGLTIGEYLLMVNEMGWIKDLARVDLTIIPLINWKRNLWYDRTGLPWVPPAPDLQTLEANLVYTGTALIEGTNLSFGLGTAKPYYLIGAPWVNAPNLADILNRKELPGVTFKPVEFQPRQKAGVPLLPVYQDQNCSGVEIIVTDREIYDPILTAVTIIVLARRLYPRQFIWNSDHIDKLFGYNLLRTFAEQHKDPVLLPPRWTHDLLKFSEFRSKFLLYP